MKDKLGRTRFQRLWNAFWTSRVGLALNILLGYSTVYKLYIKSGTVVLDTKHMIIKDSKILA